MKIENDPCLYNCWDLIRSVKGNPMNPSQNSPDSQPLLCPLCTFALRVANGDKMAFAEIYVELIGPVAKHINIKSRSSPELEDLIQETFIRAMVRIHTFDTSRCAHPKGCRALLSWVLRIATNVIIDGFRKTRRVLDMEIDERLPADDISVENKVIENEFRDKLHEFVAGLPSKNRKINEEYWLNGKRKVEISEEYERPYSTVSSAIKAGEKYIKFRLEKWIRKGDSSQ